VVPTALKVALMGLLTDLESQINHLRSVVEQHEKNNHLTLRIGYTQMQEAVPTSFGKLFSTYNEALSRDWWRVSKCFERIKLVNLGGGALGTGLAIPRYFIMEVVNQLRKLTDLPIARSENLADATSNLDSFVEIHATLKAHAVNLEKIVSDLRLLASDFANPQLSLPQAQVGSSIMPGKINPVIPEFVISIAHKIYANDQLISGLSAQGCLELNAYLPVIGHALIDSLKLLIAADKSLGERLFNGLTINKETSRNLLLKSPSVTTLLNPLVGYHKASELARFMKNNQTDILSANAALGFLPGDILVKLFEPENLLKLGFVLDDLEA
jgi:aspartate ammonia-lyase